MPSSFTKIVFERRHHSREGITFREESVMDTFVITAGKMLLGEEADIVLLTSFEALNNDIDEIDLDILLERCKHGTWETAAKIAQAVVVRTYGADGWPRLLTHKKIFTDEFRGTPYFLAGLALGSFMAADWLDHNCPIRSSFSDAFPQIICDFVTCQTEAAKLTNNIITTDYEKEIGKAIKQYVRPTSKNEWLIPHRLIEMARIFKFVRETMEGKNLSLFPLGTLIMDQLFYGMVGSISTLGRTVAMDYLLNENIDRIAGKVRAK